MKHLNAAVMLGCLMMGACAHSTQTSYAPAPPQTLGGKRDGIQMYMNALGVPGSVGALTTYVFQQDATVGVCGYFAWYGPPDKDPELDKWLDSSLSKLAIANPASGKEFSVSPAFINRERIALTEAKQMTVDRPGKCVVTSVAWDSGFEKSKVTLSLYRVVSR